MAVVILQDGQRLLERGARDEAQRNPVVHEATGDFDRLVAALLDALRKDLAVAKLRVEFLALGLRLAIHPEKRSASAQFAIHAFLGRADVARKCLRGLRLQLSRMSRTHR